MSGLSLLLPLLACTEPSPLDSEPDSEPPEISAEEQAVVLILNRDCAACHGQGSFVAEGLDLSIGVEQLVGVPSTQWPAMMRVEAGHPEDSYLVVKLEDRQRELQANGLGEQMPSEEEPLSQEDLDAFYAWIEGLPAE